MNNFRELNDEARYKTSIMVSFEYLEFLKNFRSKFGGFANFLSFLVKNNIKTLEIKPPTGGKILTEYQKKGLKLTKLNFMPRSRDWTMLKDIAFHYGISVSLLFAILFKKFLENQGQSREKQKIVHVLNLKINRKLTFERSSADRYLQILKLKL